MNGFKNFAVVSVLALSLAPPAAAGGLQGASLLVSNAFAELVTSAQKAAARVNLGIGTIATQNSNAVAVTGGSIAGASLSTSSTIVSTTAPQSAWNFDGSGGSQVVASGGTLVLSTGSGLIMLTNGGNGDIGLFLVGGGVVKILSTTQGTWVASGSPASGNVGVSYTSSGYTITSNYGSSISVGTLLLRARVSN